MNNFENKYLKCKFKYLKFQKINLIGGTCHEITSDEITQILESENKIIIGRGYKVVVYIERDIVDRIYKMYYSQNVFYLAERQFRIQEIIKTNLIDIPLQYVKIPNILSILRTDENIIIEFERVYNIYDTEPNNPSQMLNVILTNNTTKPKNISGRGTIFTLNDIEGIIGTDMCHIYLYELGKFFAILNFNIGIIINDIEIMFGKENVSDTEYKFYVLDFDRCTQFNLIDENSEKVKELFDEKEYNWSYQNLFNFTENIQKDKIKREFLDSFKKGYVETANFYGIPIIKAENIFINSFID